MQKTSRQNHYEYKHLIMQLFLEIVVFCNNKFQMKVALANLISCFSSFSKEYQINHLELTLAWQNPKGPFNKCILLMKIF